MLQVHPDSTCDVCLDPYNFSNNAKTPHAIGCGHVFCLECLAHLNNPTSCPLCRKTFIRDRIKKLHIDPHVLGAREAAMPEAWSLAQRLARCARSEVSIQATDELIEEGRRWLEVGDHKELFPEVDAVFTALIKYKTLQERSHDQENRISTLTSRLHREEAMKDESRRDALVERGLTRKIRELESQLDFYRKHYPGVRELAWDGARVNSPSDEDRANGGRSNQGNPLPSPPIPKYYPYTAHNPNFVPSSQDPYLRTSIPPVSQPYVNQTGAGAVFYEGASHDERVVPPAVRDMAARDALPEREQARSRSGHSDHSAERRNRRREGESDKTRRRRDHRRRDTLEGGVDPTVPPGEPVLGGNALGFHPSALRPGQDPYSSMPPAPPVTSDPSTSRARGGSFSRPPTSHGMAPPIAGAASVPGSAYRDASHNNGAGSFYSYRGDGSMSRPSSTPIGPVLTPWAAPGLANPSMNSLGLSERSRDVNSIRSQAARPMSASNPPTARDSVSSWGTGESTSVHSGDLFSTLRRLESAPADSGFPSNDLLPRPDGQLLGIGRYAPIETPQPQLPQAQPYVPPMVRDTDSSRSYSRHGQHPLSQSQTSLLSSRDASQPPPLFTPENRGFPYASVPPPPPLSQPSFPVAHPASQSAVSATSTRPSSHTVPMPLTLMASFPSAPPPVNSASRPHSASQPYFPSASTPQSQNPSYR